VARLFDDGANQYIDGAAVLTGVPITMACWYNSNDLSVHQVLMGLTDFSVTDQYILLIMAGFSAGDPVGAIKEDGVGSVNVESSTGSTVDTWHHAAGVFAAVDDTRVYIDGGSKQTTAVSSTPSGIDKTALGVLLRSGANLWYMSGLIAEAAIWNIALSDAEVAVLAEGYSPLLVHPQNLVFYAPLIREILDTVGGVALTNNNGVTVGDHSRVLLPPPPALVEPPVAVVAAIASQRLKIGVGR
jgi:hypothetical protein